MGILFSLFGFCIIPQVLTATLIDSTFPVVINGDSVRFFVHEVGKYASNHLAYTFYLIGDNHIGGVDDLLDYNRPSYNTDLDLEYGNTGGTWGSYPGWRMDRVITAINEHYEDHYGQGVEQGEGVFALHVGDISVTAERAELQHAKMKLDNLLMPWVPEIGNHDTWPWASTGDCIKSDWYFEQVFGPQFNFVSDILPGWTKQTTLPLSDSVTEPTKRPQSWAFHIGPNHHVGLDFNCRSLGGIQEPWGTLLNGSWDWFKDHLPHQNQHERLVITAHNPLRGIQFPFEPGATGSIVGFIASNEPNRSYWFSGHTHPDHDHYFYCDADELLGTYQVEVHVTGATDGSSEIPIPVGLVHVYSDFICDYTIEPQIATVDELVKFESKSKTYSGDTITDYGWKFGIGEERYFSDANKIYYWRYVEPGLYWTEHGVWRGVAGGDAYMIRPVYVTLPDPIPMPDPPYLHPIELLEISGPDPQNSAMSHLAPPSHYEATLTWEFHWPLHKYVPTCDFLAYRGGRVTPSTHLFVHRTEYSEVCSQVDPNQYMRGTQDKTICWEIYADIDYYGDSTRLTSNRRCETIKGTDDTTSGCPEVAVYHNLEIDTLTSDTSLWFLENNSILPHSEHAEHAMEVRTDLLALNGLETHNGHYYLSIRENDDETTHLYGGKLWVVDHPEGTKVATSSDSSIYVYSEEAQPISCMDNNGVDCFEEVLQNDHRAYVGSAPSYLTAVFEETEWVNKGLVVCVGNYGEAMPWDPGKNYYALPNKGDGQGGWTPIGGEAYARKNRATYVFDVSDVDENYFRIDCMGDSCYINYVALVKLDSSDVSITEVLIDSAILWLSESPSSPPIPTNCGGAFVNPNSYVIVPPQGQLSLSFGEVPPDTTRHRDFVLQTRGYYIPSGFSSSSAVSEPPALTFALDVQQLSPLGKNASIRYSIPYETHVKIAVYDVQGRLVSKLVEGEVQTGVHELVWDGKDAQGRPISAGIYFIKMNSDGFRQQEKIVVLR